MSTKYNKRQANDRLKQEHFANMFGWYLEMLLLLPKEYSEKWNHSIIDWYRKWDKLEW